jgi:hypothetical protein
MTSDLKEINCKRPSEKSVKPKWRLPIDLVDEVFDSYLENKARFNSSNFSKSAFLLKTSKFQGFYL